MPSTQPTKKTERATPPADTDLLEQCALFDVQRLSRALTGLYNRHLRDTGMTIAQYTLLRNIAALECAGITQIGEAMLMDRTTVTRLIDPLIQRGMLAAEAGEDRRTRKVIVTREGRTALRHGQRAWESAQKEFYDRVGPDQWRMVRGALRATLKAIREDERRHRADR